MATSDITDSLSKLGLAPDTAFPQSADPSHNPVDIYKSYVAEKLAEISQHSRDTVYAALDLAPAKGVQDLVLPIPKLGKSKSKPADLAKEWAEAFPKDIVTAESSGIFMQFKFPAQRTVRFLVPHILAQRERYGTFDTFKGKKGIVEFSSPNIAKPFHAGHLRSTIIGAFLANLHEAMGWEVIRMNYLGDWGKQYGLLALGYEAYGDEAELKKDAIKHLYDVYVKINTKATEEEEAEKARQAKCEAEGTPYEAQETLHDRARSYFKAMESGSEAELGVWRKFRDLSIVKLEQTYARLNIHYDFYSGESQVTQARMDAAMARLKEKNLLVEEKGALLVDLVPANKKLGRAIVQKRDGTTLYLTRDLGEVEERWNKHKFDKMIYVVAAQQDLYLAQLFKVIELMGHEFADRLQHINFGMVLGMSTRRGTAVFLDEILEEAKATMYGVMQKNEEKFKQIENPEQVADIVGITAVMIQDMSGKRINDYAFAWDRMTSFEGDTGPYLQYAHSRLCSVQRKNPDYKEEDLEIADFSLLTEPIVQDLVKLLMTWPSVVLNTYKTQEASNVVTYLFRLCHAISGAYDKLWVTNQPHDLAQARLALYVACRIVLGNGMRLLGLKPLERM
jgi:arginyl-tRNA synthetase